MQKLKILKDELKSYSILSIFLSLAAIGMIITVGFRIAFDSIFYINDQELSTAHIETNSKNNISIFDIVYDLIPKKILFSYIISNIISFLFFVTFITNCVLSTQYKDVDTGSYIFNIVVQVLILILLVILTYLIYSENIYTGDEAENLARKQFINEFDSVIIKDENYKSFSFYINLIVVYIFSLILLLFSILSLNSHNRRKKLINPTSSLSTLHSSN